ncbi:unnamed protein product [Durusdinium trenchii]|uniref:Uncharacterized protein n=1 Tax=Durusdinium trenchii TaxID=1381693 RepID=A0ABP0PTV2_9DINO
MWWPMFMFAWCLRVLGSRVQPSSSARVLSSSSRTRTNPKDICAKGIHMQLMTSLADQHAVNPNSDVDEEHHFILSRDLMVGEQESGWCADLVRSPPLWEDKNTEIWDPDMSEGLSFLYGRISVGCEESPEGKAILKIQQYSCREMVPFSTIWANDPAPSKRLEDQVPVSRFEYSEFTCSNPLQALPSLLHVGPIQVLSEVGSLEEATSACDGQESCQAVAIEGGQRFHLLNAFTCPLPPDGLAGAEFHTGDAVRLRLSASSAAETAELAVEGKVLEDWNLQDLESEVFVQFADRAEYVLPEHLVKEKEYATSWEVLQKVRKRKVFCESLLQHSSCDIYSKAMAEKLLDGATPSSCQEACSERMAAMPYLRSCELFELEDEDRKKFTEWAGECYQEKCSLDPECAVGKGDVPAAGAHGQEIPEGTLLFDFAHPLSTPFTLDPSQGLIYHVAAKKNDRHVLDAMKDKNRLLRVVGHADSTAGHERRALGKLPKNLQELNPKVRKHLAKIQKNLQESCDRLSATVGRRFLAPNLVEAVASDACETHRSRHSMESCVVKAGCRAESPEESKHPDWMPFSPLEFSQLPYDLLAWQRPVPFCCASAYSLDERQERMARTLLEKADVKGVNLKRIEDRSVRASLKDSVATGTAALKKMLNHHVSNDEELDWLGQMVRTALDQFKSILSDLQETVDTESSNDLEISEDGTTFLQVCEHGDQITPSGKNATVVARWSPEHQAFLQIDPGNALKTVWNVIASVPGAVFRYGLKPLWNFVAKPLLRYGVSLVKWILEHPRAALFVAKFGVLVRDQLCEKVSWHIYGDPGVNAVGALAYASESAQKLTDYAKQTFSPAVLLTGLKEVLGSAPFMDSITEMGKFSFSLLLGWTGLASGGAAVALLGTLSSIVAQAGLEAGRRAMELMIYQEIANEIPANLFDIMTKKCLYKREPVHQVTWNATQSEVMTAGKDAIQQVTQTVAAAGKTLTEQMSRWSSLLSSFKGSA